MLSVIINPWFLLNFTSYSQDLIVYFIFNKNHFYNYHWLKKISILIRKHIWMTIGLLRSSILFITKGFADRG